MTIKEVAFKYANYTGKEDTIGILQEHLLPVVKLQDLLMVLNMQINGYL